MNFCLNYGVNPPKHLDLMDELTIHWAEAKGFRQTLIPFLQKYSDKRINITIPTTDNNILQFFIALQNEHPELNNYILKLPNWRESSIPTLPALRDNNIKYFFSTFVDNWDTLVGYTILQPTDIYITNELGFEIKQVATLLHKQSINVRVFPNVAQSSWEYTPGIMKFFIRPEDLQAYSPYVDTCEFLDDDKNSKTHAYLRIYKDQAHWKGNLNEIIIDLHQDIPNSSILPNFVTRRLECGKRCLKGRPCQVCAADLRLAEILDKANLSLSKGNHLMTTKNDHHLTFKEKETDNFYSQEQKQ